MDDLIWLQPPYALVTVKSVMVIAIIFSMATGNGLLNFGHIKSKNINVVYTQ